MNTARKLAAAVALAAPLAVAGISSASAHTPIAQADCDGLTFQATSYRAGATNTVTVTVDGETVSGWDHKEFGSSTHGDATIPADASEHTWKVVVHTSDDEDGSRGWSQELSGTVGPCAEEPTPSETPTTPAETPSESPTTEPQASETPTTDAPSTTPAETPAETPTPSTTETVSGPPVQTDQVAGDGTGLVPVAALGAFAVVAGAGTLVARRRTR